MDLTRTKAHHSWEGATSEKTRQDSAVEVRSERVPREGFRGVAGPPIYAVVFLLDRPDPAFSRS